MEWGGGITYSREVHSRNGDSQSPYGSPGILKVCIQFLVYYMFLVLHIVCVWEPEPCSLLPGAQHGV